MNNRYKKVALSLSLMLILLWGLLGAGASLAWFADTDEGVKNVFHFAEFDLEVYHRLDNGQWEEIRQDTKIFDDDALYEPGYTQVVYLKIENKGTVPFDFKAAVTVTDYTWATNVLGQKFSLQEYLKFGLVIAEEEDELLQKMADRELANQAANMPLSRYATEKAPLDAKDTVYMAIIVRMPEEVDNVANYRGDVIPRVELGLIVTATQQDG